MQSSLPNTQNYLSYYHLTLSVGGLERYMGRVNHFQVTELSGESNHADMSHSVRFYDGSAHRELLGAIRPCEDGAVVLDMGQGKTYRFKKQEC